MSVGFCFCFLKGCYFVDVCEFEYVKVYFMFFVDILN